MLDTSGMVKVMLMPEPAEWHSVASETLWATPIGPGLYRLENSPFYAKGFSYLDTVIAEFDADAGFPVGKAVANPSGHSTYAIWVVAGADENPNFLFHWSRLEEIGCSYESASNHLLSVDVPASVDLTHAYQHMQAGEDDGVWFFQEQNFEHGPKG